MKEAEDYVSAIVSPLLFHPESASIKSRQDEMGIFVEISLHKEDMGMIIGREGSTAKAIRHLMRMFGTKHRAHISLKINEPEGSNRRPYEPDREQTDRFN